MHYLNMSAYLLFTRETAVSMPITSDPEAFVMGFASTDMNRCDVGGKLVARRECLGTRLPIARMCSRTLVNDWTRGLRRWGRCRVGGSGNANAGRCNEMRRQLSGRHI